MERRHTIGPMSELEQDAQITASGKKKRFRRAYSCRNCRHRKIKCDRTFPCQQCQSRGIDSSCGTDSLHKDYEHADEQKKMYLHYVDNLQMQRLQSQSSSNRSFSASMNDSESTSPPELTLDTLTKTMENFQKCLSQMQEQVDRAYTASSSSSSIRTHKRHIHRRSYSASGHQHQHQHSNAKVDNDKQDLVLKQLKSLEYKIKLIYDKLLQMQNTPMQATTTTVTSTSQPSAHSIPMQPPQMIGRMSTTEPANASAQNMPISVAQFRDDHSLAFDIDRWLEQECLPLGTSTSDIVLSETRRSSIQTVPPSCEPLLQLTEHFSL